MQQAIARYDWEQAAGQTLIDQLLAAALMLLSAVAILGSAAYPWSKLLLVSGLVLACFWRYRSLPARQVKACSLCDGQFELSLLNGRRLHATPVSAYLTACLQVLRLRGADGRVYTVRMWPWPGSAAAQQQLRLLILVAGQVRRQDD